MGGASCPALALKIGRAFFRGGAGLLAGKGPVYGLKGLAAHVCVGAFRDIVFVELGKEDFGLSEGRTGP